MSKQRIVRGVCALVVLVGCSSKRDLGNLPDGGSGGMTETGGADGGMGTGGGSGGASEGGAGGAGTGGYGGTGGAGGSTPRCDPSKPFGPPTVVPNINSPGGDAGGNLADDLTLYFTSERSGGPGSYAYDIYVATRSSPSSSFGTPQVLVGVNGPNLELWPRLTSDQLTMFYVLAPAGTGGGGHVYMTTRASAAVAFAPGAPVAQVNSTADEGDIFSWRDGAALYFGSARAGGLGQFDIYVAYRRSDGSYGTPQPVSELNTTAHDSHPVVSADGLTVYWTSNRADGGPAQGFEIWRGSRSSTSESFGNLARVSELNSADNEAPDWISADQCKMYLTTTRPGGPGGQDIWEASRPPVPTGTITEFPVPTPSSEPFGIVAGPDGNVWFTEYSAGRIGRITVGGTITELPTPATSEVPGIAFGPDGNVWFTEGGANKIGRMTLDGTITELSVPTAGGYPYNIVPGPDGNLWFTENHGNRIGRVTTTGAITEYPVPTASSQPLGITVGPDGNLWFTEYASGKIGRITTSGAITEFQGGGNPWDIVAGADGNLWFTEEVGNKIGRVTTAGAVVEYPVPTALSGPQGITRGPDGNLWFSESAGGKIGRVTPGGTFTEFVLPSASAQPAHITTGPDGALWFAEEGGNRIGRLMP